MEAAKISNLYNLEETIAGKLFEGVEYPSMGSAAKDQCIYCRTGKYPKQ